MANSAASGNINLNVLITGGAGYVSSVLLETIERLQLSRSLKIILLDKTMISEIPQAAATEVVTHEVRIDMIDQFILMHHNLSEQ